MKTLIIIPSRLSATRLPGKPLLKINGLSIISHVFKKAEKANIGEVVVATEDLEIMDDVKKNGGQAILTEKNHKTGTDRIYEALQKLDYKNIDLIMNLQGDEPLILGSQILTLADSFKKGHQMATLATPFTETEAFYNPNEVKVVCSLKGNALYFSRSPIPYARASKGKVSTDWLLQNRCYKHIGLYGYSAEFLRSISRMRRGQLEAIESLEQLRVLENGHSIYVGISNEETIGIDTIEDVENFKAYLAS